MKKLFRIIGFVLLLSGVLVTTFAAVARVSPPADPTGAGATYDQSVEAYNQQVEQLAKENNLPTPAKGKSRLDVHREDTMFAMLAGGVLAVAGCLLFYFARAQSGAVLDET